jgi:hypothetical protein
VPQHILNSHLPLVLKARSQLLCLLGAGLPSAPHLRPTGFGSGKGRDQVTATIISLFPL